MPTIELLAGIHVGMGVVERHLEVKKLSGKIQRDARSTAAKKNPVLVYDSALNDTIVSVGSAPASKNVAASMTIGDRDWSMFQLRDMSFGNIIHGNYDCKACKDRGEKNFTMEHPFDIHDLAVKRISDEETRWWNGERVVPLEEVAEADRKKLRFRGFEISLPEHKTTAFFRFPDGREHVAAGAAADGENTNEAEIVQSMMAATLLKLNDRVAPTVGFSCSVWDGVDIEVVNELQVRYMDALPGIDTRKTITCARGHELEVVLRATDFLSPTKTKKAPSSP